MTRYRCLNLTKIDRVRHFASCSFGVVIATVVLASPAAAQRSAGPYAGILGGVDDATARQTLTVRGSASGVWDDIIADSTGDPDFDRRFLRSGLGGGASGSVSHALRSRRLDWQSSANSAFRLYGSDDSARAVTFGAGSAVNAGLSSRVAFSSSANIAYSPYYRFGPALDDRLAVGGEFGGGFGVATAAERNLSADGTAGVTVRLSRRNTIDVDGHARRYDFLDQPDNSVTWIGGGAVYRRSLTSTLGVHGGFAREEARYDVAQAPNLTDDTLENLTNDTIDIGVDYGDTLEFTRRTSLSFSTSTAAIRWRDETHWRLEGSATLTRAFSRTMIGLLEFARDTEFTPGFREPLLTNTFTGGLSDQIGRRTSWSASAGYSRGSVGFDSNDGRGYDAYNAGGRLTLAVTRNLGLFTDYTYYRYEVPAGATVFTFLPKFSRQSVSVGLSVWKPVINDTRPPRESGDARYPRRTR